MDVVVPLDASYAHCRKTTLASGSNLAWGFWILPREQRRAMDALYAFARASDDCVDAAENPHEARRALDAWRQAVKAALDDPSDAAHHGPILPALADATRRFSIDRRHLMAILDGCASDTEPVAFKTIDDTEGYCRLVASAVGLACLAIWGHAPGAESKADSLGIALQWTNILRDLKEDAARGRCYLPSDLLAQHALAPATWFQQATDEQFCAIVERVAHIAAERFRESEGLESLVHRPGRHVCRLMREAYFELLTTIARDPMAPRKRRVRLTWFARAKAIARTIRGW